MTKLLPKDFNFTAMLFFGTRLIIGQVVLACHQVEKIAANNRAQ
jgi:hypothetical protein